MDSPLDKAKKTLYRGNPSAALQISLEEIALAKDMVLISGLRNVATVCYRLGQDYEKARQLADIVVDVTSEISSNRAQEEQSIACANISDLERLQGNYPDAVLHAKYAQGIAPEKSIAAAKAEMYMGYARIAKAGQQPEKIPSLKLKYFTRASGLVIASIAPGYEKEHFMSRINNVLAGAYIVNGEHMKALPILIDIATKNTDINPIIAANAMCSIGEVFKAEDRYMLAANQYDMALNLFRNSGHERGASVANLELAFCYKLLGNSSKSQEHIAELKKSNNLSAIDINSHKVAYESLSSQL